MPKLTLHFEASQGTDLESAAADLEAHFAELAGVETAEARPQRFQSVGPAEILAVVSFVAAMAQNTATLVKAIQELREAWQRAKAKFPGLHPPTVEVGLRNVPIDQLQAADLAQLDL
jgi:hypothetical protein